jgi:hypothetical protein
MILDGPSVSVKCPTQQGVERIVEVTLVSGVTSDGSDDPSLQLLLLQEVDDVARATIVAVSIIRVSSNSYSSGRDAQWWCRPLAGAQESNASQTLPPTEARKKSPAAPAPSADALSPCAGDGATSPSGWTGQSWNS